MNIVKPCSNAQALFVESESDITILNGAGVGKSFGNLLIHRDCIEDPKYSGLIAKASARAASYTFDEAVEFYKDYGIKAFSKNRRICFDSGARIDVGSGATVKDIGYAYGAQYDKVTVDDASIFKLETIFYLMTRIRGQSSIPKQLYLTCNADEESEIKPFVLPWLDDKGYPKEESNGKEYYLYRDPELGIVYTSSPEIPWQRSVKFIHDKADNNPYLKDTKYLEYLLSCNKVDSLYYGKW
jgi:hypothetical protein